MPRVHLNGTVETGARVRINGIIDADSNVVALTAGLFTDPDTFYAAALQSSITLSPALFTDADTFYAAALQSSITLSPALYDDADTFYAATLQSSIGLSPTLFTDDDTFYAATLAASITLTPVLFTDADTFYAAAVTPGAVTLSPSLFTDEDTFYAATLSQASPQTLTPTLFTDADTFYAAAISSGRQGGGWETYVAPRRRKTLTQYKKEYFELPYVEIVDKKEEVESTITQMRDEVEFSPDTQLIARLKVAIETQKIKLRALKWVEETKLRRDEEKERAVHDDLLYIVAYLLEDEDDD